MAIFRAKIRYHGNKGKFEIYFSDTVKLPDLVNGKPPVGCKNPDTISFQTEL